MTADDLSRAELSTSEPSKSNEFFGWRIVGAAFLAQLLANAVTISSFSNFVIPLSESFAVSRQTISIGTTIAIGSLGLLSPFVGRLMDRGHARLLMTGGAIWCGVGLLLLSQVDDIRWLALIFGGFVCSGAALFGPMPSMTLVANWFVKKRGFALGLTYAGATLTSAISPVVAQFLIDASGWRMAMLCFGVTVLVVGVPAFAILVIGRPEEVDQLPDGERPLVDPTLDPEALGRVLSIQEIARDPRLWLVSLGFGLVMTSPVVLVTLLIPYGLDLGLTAQQANLFLIAMLPFSLMGKLAFGALADRSPAKPIIALIVVANVVVWMIFYTEPSFWLFVGSGAIYGIGIGGVAPVQGVVLGRCFGRVNFGTASGLGGVLAILLLISATLMATVLQGEEGEGYPTLFLTQAGLLLLGGLVLSMVRIPAANESDD